MGVTDYLPGGSSAREKAERLRERREEVEAKVAAVTERQEAAYERAVAATVEGDDEAAQEALAEFRDLRPERRVAEAAVEELEAELAELRKPVLVEEHREAVERSHGAGARAETHAADLVAAVEELIEGPAARLAAGYREMLDASRRAGELERELEEEHDAEPDATSPYRVDRRFKKDHREAWAALEALREWNGSRR